MSIHYEFPCMQYWHTIAKHFEGNENFIVVDKDEYFVVNYVRAGDDTHPTVTSKRETVLREGRGLIFCSKTGELLSRPFHKFFNLGERKDIVADFTKPHHIITKLDGCLEATTLLRTPYGNLTIKEICESEDEIVVLAYDHIINKVIWTLVEAKLIQDETDDWYKIETEDGEEITITGNHLVWSITEFRYKPAKDLTENEEIMKL
jgi:hypothetical protein